MSQITDTYIGFAYHSRDSRGEFTDEALVNACQKLVVFGCGFSMDEMLTLLLNGTTVDQLLDIIGRRIAAMEATPPD